MGGVRRGSAAAQAQRDIDEARSRARAARERGLAEFLQRAERAGNAERVFWMPHARYFAQTLIDGYRENIATEAMAEQLFVSLSRGNSKKRRESLQQLAVVAALDDPLECPGLTAPAVSVLAQCFKQVQKTGYEIAEANFVIEKLSVGARDSAHYLRLQPLYESLAALLEEPSG